MAPGVSGSSSVPAAGASGSSSVSASGELGSSSASVSRPSGSSATVGNGENPPGETSGTRRPKVSRYGVRKEKNESESVICVNEMS